jgi:hypothetical protein
MFWLLAAWVFWLMLSGKLVKYAGFVTTANPAGGLSSIFAGFSIPVSIGSAKAATQSALGQPTTDQTTGTGGTATPGASQSGQALTGPDVTSSTPPGTQTNFLGNLTASDGSNVYSASADSLTYLKQAQSYVAGGAGGL